MCRAAVNLQCLAHMKPIILPADTRKDRDSFHTIQSQLKHWYRSKSGRKRRIKDRKKCVKEKPFVFADTHGSLLRQRPVWDATKACDARRSSSHRRKYIEMALRLSRSFCTVHKNVSTEPVKYNSAFFFKRPSLFRAIQNVRTGAKRFHPNPHLNSWTKYCGYLPWNQSLQASHSIINWVTS